MISRILRRWWGVAPLVLIVVWSMALAGCKGTGPTAPGSTLSGTIEIDGSSTVFPITEAVAEEFHKLHPQMRINVGISGTGGGFKRFVAGETQISDASRPISSSEKEQAGKNNVEWVELPVAYDGLSVMVNPKNTWVTSMTTAELKKLWEPESTIKRWNQIRPEWPDRPINLYGPGTDSGTFDYFTEVIMGKAKASRPDYTASEDDNVLVQGIAGDPNALGYFGYAYYVENKDKLKLVSIDAGKGAVLPSGQTILDGTYSPLSRPIFIYVNKAALPRPEVKEFVRFYMTAGPNLVSEVGYVPMPATVYNENLSKIQ
ncbi:MAG: PstS family phosphate ABC transporter substrate-binding protein [Dehalococcoidia bacterium]|nr:PstS family phosphate ABC transporter substrate-binding protein [Dehalococcoidia bacterium]